MWPVLDLFRDMLEWIGVICGWDFSVDLAFTVNIFSVFLLVDVGRSR